jgi:hypothetical protein
MLGELGRALVWDEAFTERYDYDAMVCPYYRADIDAKSLPRLSGSAGNHPDLMIGSIWIDVDNPGHSKWPTYDAADAGAQQVLDKLPAELRENVYWYCTRAGVRLVWRLKEPVRASHWRSFASQFLTMLSVSHRIDADPCSQEWSRCYRLPKVRRDGENLSLPVGLIDGQQPISWEPIAELDSEVFPESADVNQWPREAPTFNPDTDTPSRRDYSDVKESEFYDSLVQPSALGTPGDRHRTMMRCASTLAASMRIEDPTRVFRLMAPAVLADTTRDAPGLQELWDVSRWVCAQQRAERVSNDELRETLYAKARRVTAEQRSDDDDDAEYDPTADEVAERIVLIKEKAHYVLKEDGTYFGPIPKEQVYIALRQHAPSVYPMTFTSKGKRVPVGTFLENHARIVDSVVARVGETGIRYNPTTDQIVEGICNVRSDLDPVYDGDVNEWLTRLGGSESDRLLDWLATLTDLAWPTCALYIEGPKSIGKGMLADGIASLWGSKPATWSDFTAAFNDQLSRVPLVWADEKIPNDRFASQEASITLRQMVGNSSFTLCRKYLPSQSVTGCLRFLITANDGDALRLHEEMTRESYEAVVERIGHIYASNDAAIWLETKGGRAFTGDWVSGDRIAQHLLWLRDNRVVTRGSRFIVPGWESDHHVHLRGASRTANVLLDAICTALASDEALPEGIWIGGGKLLMTQKAAKDLLRSNFAFSMPALKSLATTLGSICDESGRVLNKNTRKKSRARSVNRWVVLNHAKKIDADFDHLKELFDRDLAPNLTWMPSDP